MTQKEKLIREYFTLKNQYDVMKGVENPWNAEPDAVDLYRWSTRNKVYELKEQIDRMKCNIERLTKEIEKQKFFDTEEGRKVKETAEKNMEEARCQYEQLLSEMSNRVSMSVSCEIGNRFVTKFNGGYDSCSIDIKYTDEDGKPMFGHDFEVRYDKQFHSVNGEYRTDYELRMNYGTMGAFNLTNDVNMVNYMLGMAKFVGNKELQKELVALFIEYTNRKKNIDRFYRENEKLIKE